MKDFEISKTQLKALEENGFSLNEVKTEKGAATFSTVKEFLLQNGIRVNGRKWERLTEEEYNEGVDGQNGPQW